MPRLRAEGSPLTSRALLWSICAAAGAALAALAGLLGRWSANPALGWAIALGAAGLGRAAACAFAASSGEDTSEGRARTWAAVGSLAALAVPALLRAQGLSQADPALLRAPLDGGKLTVGLAALLAALAAAAWSRAAKGAGVTGAAVAFAGACGAYAGLRFVDPSLILAAAALGALAAAELRERPWAALETSPLRTRAFVGAAVVGLGLAALAPNLLPTVWMARLQASYPGGVYLTLADDGTRLWGAYRFSNGDAVMLRDGVLQTPDPATARLALLIMLGQREGMNRLLLARPPEAVLALTAQKDGALVTIEDGTRAEAAVLDALGGGGSWRTRLIVARDAAPPNAALIFVPTPVLTRGLADPDAMKAMKARLQNGAAVGVLFPPGAPAKDVDAAARAAAGAFGNARVADLPKGILVLASSAAARTDPAALAAVLTPDLDEPIPNLAEVLAARVQWRSASSAK